MNPDNRSCVAYELLINMMYWLSINDRLRQVRLQAYMYHHYITSWAWLHEFGLSQADTLRSLAQTLIYTRLI